MSRVPKVRVTVQARVTVTVGTPRPRPDPLPVRLPDLPSVPAAWRGATYVLRSLLGAGDDNPKLRKSNDAGTPYKTWGLALAPARASGHQLCASASPGCRAACLHHQGHARLDPAIAACRVAKAVAWKEHRDWFADRLVYELGAVTRRAAARGVRVAVRLNLTSDIMWERDLPALFWLFSEVVFYDYSKHFLRALRFANGERPANYHLTFSRSEDNDHQCREVLDAGGTVAAVFRDRNFPDRFLGAPVIDGDATDLRFLDPPGVVVGLSAKGTARADDTGFVVDADRPRFPLAVV